MELYPFKSQGQGMEPVAVQGQNIAIHHLREIYWRRISFFESIPPFQFLNIGAITAQTVSARTAATNLDMPDEELAQIRWFPLDHVQVRVFLPGGVAKHSLHNIQAVVEDTIVNRDPCLHLTEFYVYEDNRPSFEAINFSDYNLTQCRLVAMGYRFALDTFDSVTENRIKAAYQNRPGSENDIVGPFTHVWSSGKAS